MITRENAGDNLMKRLSTLFAMLFVATSLFAQRAPRSNAFASDFQMIPVMGNVPGANNAVFQTYVALLNPTASSFSVTVALFDPNGNKQEKIITLGAGEQKTYDNFLQSVFQYTGGGGVTFRSADSAGGGRNNRFILNAEVRTSGTQFSTPVPTVDFAPSGARSFAPGISVNAATRTNIGCFNQSAAANAVVADIYDANSVKVGSTTLALAPNAWGQTAVAASVTNGYVRFSPNGAAACYAVVVDNISADGRLIPAVEFEP
jgi:hypothetical protein